MGTTPIRKMNDVIAVANAKERYKILYYNRKEKGELDTWNKAKNEGKKKKHTHVMKTSKYTYPEGHKTTKPRRSNRLQGSSVSSSHKLIKRENGVVDNFCGTLFLKIVTLIRTK